MLCKVCQSIDFSASSLHQEADDFPIDDVERRKEYLIYPHHPSIEALWAAENADCHLCCQIRKELFYIRGHERGEEYHKGPIEIRYYPKINTEGKILPPKELIVVAKTPMRNIKLLFDVVQYSSQFGL
jgi:hypothetical protein